MRNALILGRIVLTTVINGTGASFIDKASGSTPDELNWSGYAIQLNPFRWNKYGDRMPGMCLVIGLLKRV